VPVWVAELAGAFWKEVGVAEPFPRNLRGPITYALPLAVVYLSGLRLTAVRDWLARTGVACPCEVADRPLRACLVASWGCGFVFIDGADREDEQRFSLAHELAHYLRDYWQPRQLAVARLGASVIEVFDGLRPASAEERLSALVARVPIGFHWHLMRRDDDGQFPTPAIAAAERDADRLAYELLAPAAMVHAPAGAAKGAAARTALVLELEAVYGLPPAQARDYSALLMTAPPPMDPLLRQLGLAP
jgi:hypothetical protein